MDSSGIPDDIVHAFPLAVRERGADYHREGRVREVVQAEGVITAWVRGSERYDVRIFADGMGAIDYTCTCPDFASDGACAHIWATLISARRRGLMFGKTAVVLGHTAKRRVQTPRWKKMVEAVQQEMTVPIDPLQPLVREPVWPEQRKLVYVIDAKTATNTGVGPTAGTSTVMIEIATQSVSKTGEFGVVRRFSGGMAQWLAVPDPQDREIAHMLIGAGSAYAPVQQTNMRQFLLSPAAYDTTLRKIVDTGRCVLREADGTTYPVTWDADDSWEVYLSLAPAPDDIRHPDGLHYQLSGGWRRGDDVMPVEQPRIVLSDGLMFTQTTITRYTPTAAFPIVRMLREDEPMIVSSNDAPALLDALYALPVLPPVQLPAELNVTHVTVPPIPRLSVSAPVARQWGPAAAPVRLSFVYGDVILSAEQSAAAYFVPDALHVIHRDLAAEQRASDRLRVAGCRPEYDYGTGQVALSIPQAKADTLIATLMAEGWDVEHEGRRIRQPGTPRVDVTSGIDWFDLSVTIDFGDVSATLPELLTAWRRGDRTVTLSDGSIGVLPIEWFAKYGMLATLGSATGSSMRFTRTQVGLLDALLAAMPAVAVDEQFERARNALLQFDGVLPVDAPRGFIGVLRPYQRDGVGWMHFLREFGFGGCLADDMGLGKTVQLLAMLEARRQDRAGPSLVVVPKSLVFNWEQEAARFTPEMRVLAHVGTQRARIAAGLQDVDLVLTTYATLRRDAALFKDIEFDYVVLDEAQAIKNPRTESAKAARLLKGRNRLAMTGTPVENRLDDLWSIFEFLNPGVLGAASAFKTLESNGSDVSAVRGLISRVLRPFILRRTKAQVAPELPERVEQTLYVELEPEQRRLYDELRDHYRAALLDRVAREGINKAKIQILEALLRLRQAACHPGLLDPARAQEPSSKLDVLLSHISEIIAEGHKVLVFSQFTTLLGLVRHQLDTAGITYEYLDGQTHDRQARVERFQHDPTCQLFLISLKAGGVGLNLTAAEYVFLLDPWWNPAVEAQAIDRAHRIGQSQRVFATRLIARDTVEEKVLQLQETKRDLADAIINADNSVIAKLGREELELLLS